MLIFDQIRISDDGNRIYINIHVNEAEEFAGVYLDEMYITTSDLVNETVDTIPQKYIYHWTFDDNLKDAAFVIDQGDFDEAYTHMGGKDATDSFKGDISRTLFFVFVKCKGTGTIIDPCVPCRLAEETTLGVTFDVNMLYQMVMNYTRELNQDCVIPQGFIDLILKWNGFKAAIETEHYNAAIDFWKDMFFWPGGKEHTYMTKPCGCGH